MSQHSRRDQERAVERALGKAPMSQRIARIAVSSFWRWLDENDWVVVRRRGKNEFGTYYIREDLETVDAS